MRTYSARQIARFARAIAFAEEGTTFAPAVQAFINAQTSTDRYRHTSYRKQAQWVAGRGDRDQLNATQRRQIARKNCRLDLIGADFDLINIGGTLDPFHAPVHPVERCNVTTFEF